MTTPSLTARLFGGKLPPDVLLDAPRRLRVAVVACVLAFALTLLAHVALVGIGWASWHATHVRASVIGMVVSLVLYGVFSRSRLSPDRMIDLAFIAQLQLCVSLSMMELNGPDPRDPDHFGTSLVALVIVLGPVFLPAPRWKTLLVSLLCAATGPHAVDMTWWASGRDLALSAHQLFNLFAMNFVAVGLALQVDVPADARLTSADVIQGTPAFMAPEQAVGRPVDARADLYALGCVAYWLLTGGPVFDGEGAVQQVIHHVGTPPSPPSSRGVPVPADLERLVMDLLEKEPSARPGSAREVRERLLACGVPAWTRADAEAWWASGSSTVPTRRST